MVTSKKQKRRILLENILLIATVILIVGIGISVIEFLSFGSSFVGNILISGGFFGIIVYLIVGRHEKYVLKEEILGLRPDLTLVDQLIGEVTDYFYDKRFFEWELYSDQQSQNEWAVRLYDKIDINVVEETREIVFMRDCDIEMGNQTGTVQITDKTTQATTNVLLQFSPDLSTAVKKYFHLRYTFRAGRGYSLVNLQKYPSNMKRDSDYLEMRTPVYTKSFGFTVKFPSDFVMNQYRFDCYVIDLKCRRIRDIVCIPDVNLRTVTVSDEGPLKAGETIVFKYFKES